MTDKEIGTNMAALGILVITIVPYDDCGSDPYNFDASFTCYILFFSNRASNQQKEFGVKVPRDAPDSYEGRRDSEENAGIQNRQTDDRWDEEILVMTETSNPQFVMARSAFCCTSSVICLLAASILQVVYIGYYKRSHKVTIGESASVYGCYTKWILIVQSHGMLVGIIAPVSRWFIAVRFKCLTTCHEISFAKELGIEEHWIQTLKYWRDSFSVIQIQDGKCRKYIHDVKWFTLTFLIRVQIMMVLLSKLLLFIPALLITPFVLCSKKFKTRLLAKVTSNKDMRSESGSNVELNLNRFVLLLDGEQELPQRTLKDICGQADKVIKIGMKQQPQNLLQLLNKFGNFSGVREFDSLQVPSLHSQEPPNCWTLPLVTLTSIAISLPNIAINHMATQLVSSVSEGLSLAMLIEKTLDQNGELMNIRNAADGAGVAIYRKWQQVDLRRISLDYKSSKNLLQELSSHAEMIILEFKRKANDFLMENPLNWPASVVAANSMYRISQTILLSYQEENDRTGCQDKTGQTDEELFERLTIMIADILAACFTNLSQVMITKCHRNAIEEREKSVHEAFLLLGRTRQIVDLLQRQEWPSLDHEKAAYIEEWRAFLLQDNENPITSSSTSSDKARGTPVSNEEHITVVVNDQS
ncbi:UNVERIFIED_CONTAM: hypothetical protein Sangu_2004200 [Sesamum angustifolium]|uniref:Uncharacterized protein n=1 Tax=Sesamum angustifolium TaxID=2727405 RepID=A0AAW2LGT3_9LAMI